MMVEHVADSMAVRLVDAMVAQKAGWLAAATVHGRAAHWAVLMAGAKAAQ